MNQPDVSIVFLTQNGGEDLRRALEAIAAQETKHSFEIVAVDSGSSDGTRELLRKCGARVQEIPPSDFSFGKTRDLAFSMARGEWIVSLSQDAVPVDRAWLENLLTPLRQASLDGVTGGQTPWPEPRPVFFWIRHGGFDFTRAAARWAKRYGGGFSLVNAAISRAVWERIPFGATPMSEDKDFQRRAVAAGCRLGMNQAANVFHGHDYSVSGLVKRTLNEGLGWRYAGEPYSLRDMFYDFGEVFRATSYLHRAYVWGWRTRGLRTLAEILFPWVRPLGIYVGNHYIERYQS